ncbi:lipase family protein [Microbacterium sp. MC2]
MGLLARLPLGRLHARMPLWLRIVLAAVSIGLGAVIIIRPTTALDVLAVLLGGGMVLTGVLEATGRTDDAERRRWRIVVSGAWLAVGVFVLFWPGLTVRLVAVLVGLLLLLNGSAGIVGTFRRRRTWDERIADAAFGTAGILFGIFALAWPDITLLVVAVVFGAWLIMRGVADLWNGLRRGRSRVPDDAPDPPWRRWGRTALAIGAVVLAVVTVGVTAPLREGSTVIDAFYAAPRDTPDEPGRLVRAEPFTRDIPANAQAWRILYTTTGVDGEIRVASGLVVVPLEGDGRWPVIDWNHGTTGYAQHCAPSLQERPLWSGAMYVTRQVINEGWAIVATDYIGLGTQGPHPYLIGPPSASASLDAVRAARQLEEADLGASTVVWGHSQGGGAALWAGSMARSYAPEVWIRGVAALAPASDPLALVEDVSTITGGSIFASFAFESFESIYPDVTARRYIRPGAQPIVEAMAARCLSDPGTVVSVLASLGMSRDPVIFAADPTVGTLARHLRTNIAPVTMTAPLLIAQGRADSIIDPASQDAFVQRMCDAGTPVDYRTYGGMEHAALVERPSPLIPELFEWTRARFAGEPYEMECTRSDG